MLRAGLAFVGRSFHTLLRAGISVNSSIYRQYTELPWKGRTRVGSSIVLLHHDRMQLRLSFARSERVRRGSPVSFTEHGVTQAFLSSHEDNPTRSMNALASSPQRRVKTSAVRQLQCCTSIWIQRRSIMTARAAVQQNASDIHGTQDINASTLANRGSIELSTVSSSFPRTTERQEPLKIRYLLGQRTPGKEGRPISSSDAAEMQDPPKARIHRPAPQRYLKSSADQAVPVSVLGSKNGLEKSSPAYILSLYFEKKLKLKSREKALAMFLDYYIPEKMQRSGYSPNDLYTWESIVTASTDKKAIRLYRSIKSRKPAFLLFNILRRSQLKPMTLRSLIIDSWRILTGAPEEEEPSIPSINVKEAALSNRIPFVSTPSSDNVQSTSIIRESQFYSLIGHLLRHARRIWPQAMVSIAHMIVFYCKQLVDETAQNTESSLKLHAKLSRIYSKMLIILSFPANGTPMKSMVYNWQAQRVLLESAGTFRPSLELSKTSYRAVARVLGASKKSPAETKYISLIQRSWPPWRKEQDGMDVERFSEEDISRAVAVISRLKEAGYSEQSTDSALRILGGRESDGTPTIQTRSLVNIRSKSNELEGKQSQIGNTRLEWAARIRATRDVYEAWAAFTSFTSSGCHPSTTIYEAMFEKLIFNSPGKYYNIAMPGDGKEVMPVLDDNLSESEKLRLQPPSLDDLYSQMVRDGIRPSGRCLNMLVSRARTFQSVIKYLHDGALPSTALESLLAPQMMMDRSRLERIPIETFAAFIKFLTGVPGLRMPTFFSRRESSLYLCFQARSHDNPVLHAFELLRCLQPSYPFAWYSLLGGLARPGLELPGHTILSPNQFLNDIMSWRFVMTALSDIALAGVQLGPEGFQFVCRGLEKALLASFHVRVEEAAPVRDGQRILKEAFARLSKDVSPQLNLPRLLYEVGPSQLHAYVRTLSLLHDTEEILSLLRWIVEHQTELYATATSSRNGVKLLRRLLVVVRIYFDESENVQEEVVRLARGYIDHLMGWGGWPMDGEVEAYKANGSSQR